MGAPRVLRAIVAASLCAAACGRERDAAPLPSRFGTIGRAATAQEIEDWNIDANASGVGLPAGQGTYARGATLFAERCAACHGAHVLGRREAS